MKLNQRVALASALIASILCAGNLVAGRVLIVNENLPSDCTVRFYDEEVPTASKHITGARLSKSIDAYFRQPSKQFSLPDADGGIKRTAGYLSLADGKYKVVALICGAESPVFCNSEKENKLKEISVSDDGFAVKIKVRQSEGSFRVRSSRFCEISNLKEL